jgi:hypothetical protein
MYRSEAERVGGNRSLSTFDQFGNQLAAATGQGEAQRAMPDIQ